MVTYRWCIGRFPGSHKRRFLPELARYVTVRHILDMEPLWVPYSHGLMVYDGQDGSFTTNFAPFVVVFQPAASSMSSYCPKPLLRKITFTVNQANQHYTGHDPSTPVLI